MIVLTVLVLVYHYFCVRVIQGTRAPAKSHRVASVSPKLLSWRDVEPRKKAHMQRFRDWLLNPNLTACRNVLVEHTEQDDKEPDTHICLDAVEPPCTVFSFGIAYDFSFDQVMLDRGCNVFSFDPSMKPGNYTRHARHQFYRLGIGDTDGEHKGESTLWDGNDRYVVATLDSLMQRFNVSFVDMVRMDIESAEWRVLRHWLDRRLFSRIGQLLLEIHFNVTRDNVSQIVSNARLLQQIPMTVFWTQQNNHTEATIYKEIREVWEIGFVSLDRVSRAN